MFVKVRHQQSSQKDSSKTGSPMRVLWRGDVSAVRAMLRPGAPPITLDIVHVDLHIFLDLDLVLINVEVNARDLALAQALELLYRFGCGCGYPASWDAEGHAQHCLYSAEWLDTAGQVLAQSDANQRDLFMAHGSSHRAPRIAAHWAWLLEPLVSVHSGDHGPLCYRQIEYYRMPQLAFLALDNPHALSRSDFVRFGLVTGAAPYGDDVRLPYADEHLADFEKRFLLRPLLARRWCSSQHALSGAVQHSQRFRKPSYFLTAPDCKRWICRRIRRRLLVFGARRCGPLFGRTCRR